MKKHPDTVRLERIKALLYKFVADVKVELELSERTGKKLSMPAPEAEERTFSSFEVASMLGVYHTTVIGYSNRGIMKARRTAGGHRRFPQSEVVAYMRKHGIKIPAALQ